VIVSVTITNSREEEIAGALQSVVDHVDRVLVVDTGVADRTLERAKDVAGEKLAVLSHTWVDFSAARNAGFEAAEALGADWMLIVDSDERIDFGGLDLRKTLGQAREDVLFIESDDGSYPKEKLVRAKRSVRFVGPTHEAIIGGSRELLRGVTFRELAKTNVQLSQKFERDARLLESYSAEHPNDPRWHHYLGMTYEGLERRDLAAASYGRSVELRNTGVEAAWSAFKQAEQLCAVERYGAAVQAAAKGLGADATSAECAWIAASASLKRGRKDQAVAWARMAEAIGHYRGCGPERLYFRYLPALYELPYDVLRSALTHAARKSADHDFHSAKRARMRATTRFGDDLDRLGVVRSVPENIRFDAREMIRPSSLRTACPSAERVKIQFEPPNGYLPTNPSICMHEGALWCVVRTVNYSMDGRDYVVHDPNRIVRTANYLGRLRLDGEFVEPRYMRDLDRSLRIPSQVVGYEDMRLVSVKDTLSASATACDRNDQGPRIVRLHLTPSGDVKRADVQPSNQRCEKNWMPLSIDGELAWIYSLDPTAILSKSGPLRKCALALDHLRGGAATRFGAGYLCVAHETIDEPDGRIYLHRFVRLDKKFNVTAVSPAWIFEGHGIEFCAGLAKVKKQLVLSYGVKDREAWIMKVDVKEVEAMRWITP
jgi:tetratricopeptide (TPR) repeat protein